MTTEYIATECRPAGRFLWLAPFLSLANHALDCFPRSLHLTSLSPSPLNTLHTDCAVVGRLPASTCHAMPSISDHLFSLFPYDSQLRGPASRGAIGD